MGTVKIQDYMGKGPLCLSHVNACEATNRGLEPERYLRAIRISEILCMPASATCVLQTFQGNIRVLVAHCHNIPYTILFSLILFFLQCESIHAVK